MFSKQKYSIVFRKSIYILQYKIRSKEKNYVIIFENDLKDHWGEKSSNNSSFHTQEKGKRWMLFSI